MHYSANAGQLSSQYEINSIQSTHSSIKENEMQGRGRNGSYRSKANKQIAQKNSNF